MDSEHTTTQLTEDDWAQISAMWDWNIETQMHFDMLYHYYKGDTLRKVLKNDAVIFRLASASTFEDKMEGKAVEVYYDLALEELWEEGKITEMQFEKLSGISIPNRIQFVFQRSDGWGICKNEEYEEYIICFSTEKDDLYMYETYAHDSDGYCLHFFGIEIEELRRLGMKNHAEIRLVPILYGKEVVDFIKEKVHEVISDAVKERNLEYYITDLLHYVQFAAKRKKYSRENEVRLIVFLPVKCGDQLSNIRFYTDTKDHKYIFFSAPKHVLYDVSAAPYNAKTETSNVKAYLDSQGYQNMLEAGLNQSQFSG